MKLTMLGTGNALVTECYNTCFVLEENNQYLLVDGGGGNGILHQLKHAGINWKNINSIFVTHKHLDHITGIIWMIRMICQHMKQGEYDGDATIYAHEEAITLLIDISQKLLQKKNVEFINKRLHFKVVGDGEKVNILKLTCCGDEPYNICEEKYVKDSKWLLHEAFCLNSQSDIFHPYEKHHSTVKDACEIADTLNIENIILYHTEDHNLKNRKELYIGEGKKYFKGNIFVPNDLEFFDIE